MDNWVLIAGSGIIVLLILVIVLLLVSRGKAPKVEVAPNAAPDELQIDRIKALVIKSKKRIDELKAESEKLRDRLNIALIENEKYIDENRDLSARVHFLEENVVGDVDNLSYRPNDVVTSKRIADAVAEWQDKVIELETKISLMSIQENTDSDLLKRIKELMIENEKISVKINQKEEENVDLTLKLTKAVSAYDKLNKRYKELILGRPSK